LFAEEEHCCFLTKVGITLKMVDSTQNVPGELWDHVLEHLMPYSGKLIPIELRASLSVESFQSTQPGAPEDVHSISNFVCQPSLLIAQSYLTLPSLTEIFL
jgi:hypothetical protein